jgi:hypothetical protein
MKQMNVNELLEWLPEQTQDGLLRWPQIRKEIVGAHQNAQTTAERVTCLSLHKALMDEVDKQISGPDLKEFRTAREQDYCRLLLAEAVIGRADGIIEPKRMLEITQREIDAGRMSPDDGLHTDAVAAVRGRAGVS